MTSVAIQMLQKEENGYFLFVEGGLIDLGHHLNEAHKALDETVEFNKAIEVNIRFLWNNRLSNVIVESKHTMLYIFNLMF